VPQESAAGAQALAPIDRHMTAARGRAHGQWGFLSLKN